MPQNIYQIPSGNVGVTTTANSAGQLMEFLLDIPTKDMLGIVRNQMIGLSPLGMNEIGLFYFMPNVTVDKVKLAMFKSSSHLWSSRKNGCQFVPKGRIVQERAEFELFPIEYDGKQCPDEFFGTEWETLFRTGDPYEMINTPEGARALNMIVQIIVQQLGNDLWDLTLYGSHPNIDLAETAGIYRGSEKEWNDFKDQMAQVGGFLTAADYLATVDGRSNFNIEIKPADVDGDRYIGDVIDDLFPRVYEAATKEMRLATRRRQLGRKILLVTRGIFDKYKQELIERYNDVPIGYQLLSTGVTGDRLSTQDVLLHDGNVVVAFDETMGFDERTGYTTHMVMHIVPGNIPFLYNTIKARGMAGLNDFGLRIQTDADLDNKGAVFMNAGLKVGTGIINPDYVTYGALRFETESGAGS